MNYRNPQAPNSVIMVRPHHFKPNPETVNDNSFQVQRIQTQYKECEVQMIAKGAYDEFTDSAQTLKEAGIEVHIFEDKTTETPDSVFPNNWLTTHSGGHVAVYPMFAPSRRKERRYDILEMLKNEYRVQDIIDYSGMEADGLFLEGTGAMVLDHIERVVYAVKSNRTDPVLLERFCTHFNYEPMVFHAQDANSIPVYHTNVLMCIATSFAMIGLDMVPDEGRRAEIVNRLEQSGREIISLSQEQINSFAGNSMELSGKDGRVLVLSQTAFNALSMEQKLIIEKSASLLPLNVETIEMSGGSIRCMLAGVHLSKR